MSYIFDDSQDLIVYVRKSLDRYFKKHMKGGSADGKKNDEK